MSTPIVACQIYKAAKGDQKAFDHLVEAMVVNTQHGAFSTWPCACNPPCAVPPEADIIAVVARVDIEVAKRLGLGNEKDYELHCA